MKIVIEPRQEYTDNLPYVQLNRAATSGEREVKKLGVRALAPGASMCCSTRIVDGEQVTDYHGTVTQEGLGEFNKYLSLASWYGATGETVDGLTGLIFSKPPVITLPPQIEYMKDNVNGRGTSLKDFAKAISKDSFQAPWSGVLVARPSTPAGSSVAAVEAMNIRAKLCNYKFESILKWELKEVNHELKLSFVVLVECVTERKDFVIKTVKRYRVLELIDGVYNQSLLNDAFEVIGAVAPVIINNTPSSEIPFYFVMIDEEGKSIISDLVDMNFQHFKVGADYFGGLYYSSFAIYTETGAEGNGSKNNVIGNGVKWTNRNEGAAFGLLQPDGNADSSRLALQDIEARMAALGADALRPRSSGAESAEAKSLDKVTQNSKTAMVANTVSQVLTKAMNFASMWQGGTEDVIFSLNTDYDNTQMDPQMMGQQFALVQARELSSRTFYENLTAGEVANATRTYEEERKLIADEQGDTV